MFKLNPSALAFEPTTALTEEEYEFCEEVYNEANNPHYLGPDTVYYTHEDHFAFVISWLKNNS
jgi:hypothetical protein